LRTLDYKAPFSGGKTINMMDMELERIYRSEKENPRKFRLSGGALEKIIDERGHPARKALIWQNAFFGSSRRWRRKVTVPVHMHATNAPLTLHPEILEEVLRYVFLPKEVVEAYRRELARRSNGRE
jgi:hypothetical protein